MKYLKTFENVLIKRYWDLPITYPEFFAAMYKIGVPEEIQNRFSEIVEMKIKESGYPSMYVSYNNSESSVNRKWHWSYPNGTAKDFFTKNHYKFEGVVEVKEDDIERWKIKNDANKYNL